MVNDTLTNKLRSRSYSTTRPRRIVFGELLNSGAMTLPELTRRTRAELDRSSVYRTVALFEQLGFIRRISHGWKYKVELTDIFTDHHHHISCRSCGAVVDLSDDEGLDAVIKAMSAETGFTSLGHELEISGICSNCAQKIHEPR